MPQLEESPRTHRKNLGETHGQTKRESVSHNHLKKYARSHAFTGSTGTGAETDNNSSRAGRLNGYLRIEAIVPNSGLGDAGTEGEDRGSPTNDSAFDKYCSMIR